MKATKSKMKKVSVTDSLLQRNDLLTKEVMRLRKKVNKLQNELKLERAKAMRLALASNGTQTSPQQIEKIKNSPILQDKKLKGETFSSLLHTYVSPPRTNFLPNSKPSPSCSNMENVSRSPSVENETCDPMQLLFDDKSQSIESPSPTFERRPRRSSVGAPKSYKEPSLKKKIRKGNIYFEMKNAP